MTDLQTLEEAAQMLDVRNRWLYDSNDPEWNALSNLLRAVAIAAQSDLDNLGFVVDNRPLVAAVGLSKIILGDDDE